MNRQLANVLLAVLACTAVAAAQQEQWLQYQSGYDPLQTGPVPVQQCGPLSTTHPSDVKLPAFTSEKPRFFRWITEANTAASQPSAQGRWIALDQSRQGSAYDTLYIDTNGDGSLADEKPIRAGIADNSFSRFDRVRVDLPGTDGPAAYHISIAMYDFGRRLLIIPAGWYSGQVKIGQKSYWCVLVDANCNGRFDDSSVDYKQCDFLCLHPLRENATYAYQDDVRHFIGERLQIDGAIYKLTVAPDGASVAFAAADMPAQVPVRVPEGVTSVSVWSKLGHFTCKPSEGKIQLPPGEYGLDNWVVEKKDANGLPWQLMGKRSSATPTFTVKADGENTLNVGEPVKVEFVDSVDGLVHQIVPVIKGAFDTDITMNQGNTPVKITSLKVTGEAGYEKIVSMEYG